MNKEEMMFCGECGNHIMESERHYIVDGVIVCDNCHDCLEGRYNND